MWLLLNLAFITYGLFMFVHAYLLRRHPPQYINFIPDRTGTDLDSSPNFVRWNQAKGGLYRLSYYTVS